MKQAENVSRGLDNGFYCTSARRNGDVAMIVGDGYL